MGKTKYFFNPTNLKFEKVTISFWKQALRIFGFVSASLVFGGIFLAIAYYFIDSPKEIKLKREINKYELQLELMNNKLSQIQNVLESLRERDENIYRTIFEAKPIPSSVRNAGYGGVAKYKELEDFDNPELITEVAQKLDKLAKQIYVQSLSYDELAVLASKKSDMLLSIPGIQPVANKKLKGIVSGYGYRIHPIYKTKKMHTGCDFSAPTGTPIYASGNGVVTTAEYSGGYGNHVVVNHGFGYESLYGHMTKWVVRVGQKITRGTLLGYVGNTGTSTGPHLHYEVIKNGKPINPVNYFYNDLTPEEYDQVRLIASQFNQSLD